MTSEEERGRSLPFSLLAISAGRGSAGLEDWAQRLALAGVGALQVREKETTDRDLEVVLRRLVALLTGSSTRLIVNGRPDLALATGASGVHLPAEGLPLAPLKRRFPDLLFGRSTHSLAEVRQAAEEGADYVTFGPVFATPAKVSFGPPLGLEALQQASGVGIPVLALGGILTLDSLPQLAQHGAMGMAGIRAFEAERSVADLVARAQELFG